MAIVSSDLAAQWSTRFETLFLTEYNQTTAVERARLAPLLMEIPLGDHQGNKVTLDWLGAAPQLREWTDEKRAQGLGKFSWDAVVKRYEASIEIDLDALRDARFNAYEPRLREMAQNAGRLEYNLISDLVRNGATAACYDGQYFFDTDHAEGASGTQSNQLTGTGTSESQIIADYYAAYAALTGFKDDKGVPLQPTGFRPLIWIPNDATLIQRFEKLQNAPLVAGGETNVLAGKFDLVIDPRLTDTNDWFMFRTDGAMKPFILVNREAAHYEDNFGSRSDDTFKRRIGTASAVARMVATYGLWQKAVRIAN